MGWHCIVYSLYCITMWYLCVVVCDHRACISRGRTISTDTGCARNGRCVLFHAMCLTQVQQYGIFLLIIANATTCVSCTLSVYVFSFSRTTLDLSTFCLSYPVVFSSIALHFIVWSLYCITMCHGVSILYHCCTAALLHCCTGGGDPAALACYMITENG